MERGRPYAIAASTTENRPWQGAIAIAAGLATLAGIVGLIQAPMPAVLAIPVAAVCIVAHNLRRRGGSGVMRFDGEKLSLRLAHQFKQLDKGSFLAGYRTGASSLLLRETNGTQIHLTLDDDLPSETVDDVLSALGLGIGQRAITVPLRPPVGVAFSSLLAMLPLGVAASFVSVCLARLVPHLDETILRSLLLLVWLAVPVFAILLGRKVGAPELVIGDDSVGVVGAFGTRVFRYESLRHVYDRVDEVVLIDTNGSVRTIPMYGQSPEQIRGVVDRIAHAIARIGSRPSDLAPSLARGARSVAEWRAWLHGATSASGGFRDAALPIEALEALVANPRTRAEERVGAALALRAADGALASAGQMHIRIAAQATADPRIRGALLVAAADEIDDRAIEEALAHAENARR